MNHKPIFEEDMIIHPVLPVALLELKEKAQGFPDLPECIHPVLRMIDIKSWTEHQQSGSNNYSAWRVARLRGRMRNLPINIEYGEIPVGKPLIRQLTPEEISEVSRMEEIYRTIPVHPQGDCGHYTPDYSKLLTLGIVGIRREIATYRADTTDHETVSFYDSCDQAMIIMSEYLLRLASECDLLACKKEEFHYLRNIADICRNLVVSPPTTFKEAVQLMFVTIITLWFGEDHGLTTLGRPDQTLWPFYRDDLNAGRITRQDALELISCIYIQLNRILVAGSAESLIVGGRDQNGKDVTNELTYIFLAARGATRLAYPTVGLAWHKKTPEKLMDFCCSLLRTGIGDPAFFNDELISQGLQDLGVSLEDSYNYINSTCVEIKVAGHSYIWVTAPYINCAQIFLDTLAQAAHSGRPEPATYDDFIVMLKKQAELEIQKIAVRHHHLWMQRERLGGSPLASCLTNDCLASGIDFDRGGARYNWVENSFVGLANIADSCMTVKKLVYEQQELSLKDLEHILKTDFADYENLRQKILFQIPKYGNNNDEVDAIAADLASSLIASTESCQVGRHHYVAGFFCWVMHEKLGAETSATPDGRKAGTPLGDGAGAAQGRDRSGPTAAILSTTKWSHRKVMGGLVQNIKFSPQMLSSQKGIKALKSLIETYLIRGGFEIQVNVISRGELEDARLHPEKHAGLVVRVAGYSDYFVHLNAGMQEEIISRSEHENI